MKDKDLTIDFHTEPVTFKVGSIYDKLYEANGEKEVILTPEEADELLDYMQFVAWYMNPPK